MEIGLDSTVVAAGDEIGKVESVLIGATNSLLSHVVATGADGQKRAIPIWSIARGEGAEIVLDADAPEWSQFPAYNPRRQERKAVAPEAASIEHEPGEYPALFPEDGSLPENTVALGLGIEAYCGDDPVGNVVGVVADDYTAEATVIYVRLKRAGQKTVAVPAAWARSLSAKRIGLECSRRDLESLPESPTEPPGAPIEPLQRG